jgi:metal-responsive CopG/Arc/MetJ family transcriptional regulator
MKTVRITLDEDLIALVDRAVQRLKTTRSEFTRQALGEALKHIMAQQREERHRRGYAAHPVKQDEFSKWATEQVWPE